MYASSVKLRVKAAVCEENDLHYHVYFTGLKGDGTAF